MFNFNLTDYFTLNSGLVSSLLCAVAIILFFVLSWVLKKIFKKTISKKLASLNIILNVLLVCCFILSVLLILGLDFPKLVNAIVVAIKENRLAEILTQHLSKIIGVVLVIVISSVVVTTFVTILKATKARRPEDQKRKRTIDKILTSIVRYLVIIIAAVSILIIIGVNPVPALAGLGIAGLVLGLGAQKLITDFISGLFIVIEHHFDVGDVIEVGGFKGEVIDLGLKTTKIRNWQGQVKIMSNSEVTNLINCSLNDTVFSTTFDISYQADVEKAIELVNKELPNKLKDNESIIVMPECNGVSGLTARSVTLNVVATAKTETHYQLTRDINKCIKEILEENHIEFPGDNK